MNHSVKTAERYYNYDELTNSVVKALELKQSFRPTEPESLANTTLTRIEDSELDSS